MRPADRVRVSSVRARWIARLRRHVSSLPSCSSREEWIPSRSINILAFIDGHQGKNWTQRSRRATPGLASTAITRETSIRPNKPRALRQLVKTASLGQTATPGHPRRKKTQRETLLIRHGRAVCCPYSGAHGDARTDPHGDLRADAAHRRACLLYTSPSPRDGLLSRMPSSA